MRAWRADHGPTGAGPLPWPPPGWGGADHVPARRPPGRSTGRSMGWGPHGRAVGGLPPGASRTATRAICALSKGVGAPRDALERRVRGLPKPPLLSAACTSPPALRSGGDSRQRRSRRWVRPCRGVTDAGIRPGAVPEPCRMSLPDRAAIAVCARPSAGRAARRRRRRPCADRPVAAARRGRAPQKDLLPAFLQDGQQEVANRECPRK